MSRVENPWLAIVSKIQDGLVGSPASRRPDHLLSQRLTAKSMRRNRGRRSRDTRYRRRGRTQPAIPLASPDGRARRNTARRRTDPGCQDPTFPNRRCAFAGPGIGGAVQRCALLEHRRSPQWPRVREGLTQFANSATELQHTFAYKASRINVCQQVSQACLAGLDVHGSIEDGTALPDHAGLRRQIVARRACGKYSLVPASTRELVPLRYRSSVRSSSLFDGLGECEVRGGDPMQRLVVTERVCADERDAPADRHSDVSVTPTLKFPIRSSSSECLE
jgi:hypothetical protein